jgi:hypothetical protein
VATLSPNVEVAGARPDPTSLKTNLLALAYASHQSEKQTLNDRAMLPGAPPCINQKFTIYLRARLPPFKMKQKNAGRADQSRDDPGSSSPS